MPTPPAETEGPAAPNPPAVRDESTATAVTAAPEDPWPDSPHPLLTVLLAPRRRFPRWLVAVSGLTASLAVLAFVMVLAWPSGPAPPNPAPAFGPRQLVGQVTFDGATGAAFTQLAGDRAYVAWQRGDNLALVAVDLASGAELWRSSIAGEPGRPWAGLLAGPDALVAFGHPDEDEDEDGSAPAPLPMVVLSADDGERRWDRLVHAEDEMWLGVDALVLVDRAGGVVRGLRPDTGEQRWAVAVPGGPGAEAAVVPVQSTSELAGPSALQGRPLPGPYQRLVLVGQDYSARVIDTSRGTISWASNVAGPSDLLLAYGDRLYVAYDYRGYRVDEHDLDNLAGQPRNIYVSPDLRRRPVAMSPCGPGRLCLLDRPDGGAATGQVRAIDLAADRAPDPQWWVRDVPSAQWLLAAGELLLVGGWQSPMVGYDRAGEPVLEQPDGAAVRLDDDRLLLLSTGPGDWQQDLNVTGLTVGGERTELGQLPGVYGAWCSWSGTYLACPDGGGATVWRLSPTTQ